jgi:hypothetical protein
VDGNRCEWKPWIRVRRFTVAQIELLRQYVERQIGETFGPYEVDTVDKLNMCAISWKDSGSYIYENGGTYNFGPGTCKKKWIEISGIAT